MTQISDAQAYALLRAVGFSHEAAIIMTAVMHPESGGVIEARADLPNGLPGYGPEDSIGLWQINTLAHPQYDPEKLASDPMYAAKAAFEVSGGGTNFSPWTGYSSGKYRSSLGAARRAADEVNNTGNIGDVLGSIPMGGGLSGATTPEYATLGAAGRTATPGLDEQGISTDPEVQAYFRALNADPDGLVRARFPAYAMYLADPELGPILRQAATESWDSTRLIPAVQATNWWRTTSDFNRSWDQLVNADPAAATRQREDRRIDVATQFSTVGYAPDHATLMRIVEDSLRNGWDSERITQAIVASLPERYNAQQVGSGDISGTMADLRAAAASYFMPLSDDTAYSWSKELAAGTKTEQGVKSQMLDWAKANWSWMAPQLDQGRTVADVFNPMQETIAGIMGTSAAAVDLMTDSYWRQITGVTDASGAPRAPTIQDAEALARAHPRWEFTADAKNRTAGIANDLISTFTGA
jgi:hypothetical protein